MRTFSDIEDVEAAMYLDREDIYGIENITRGQCSNELWRKIRNTRLTASQYGRTLHNQNCNHIVQHFGIPGYNAKPVNAYMDAAMQWGKAHEAEALECYKVEMGLTAEDIISEPGIFFEPNGICGATPDGGSRQKISSLRFLAETRSRWAMAF